MPDAFGPPCLSAVVGQQDMPQSITNAMQKVCGSLICLFAIIRFLSHHAAQNRTLDYVLMAVMMACGIFLLVAKRPQRPEKK
jgi:hypothetical protein